MNLTGVDFHVELRQLNNHVGSFSATVIRPDNASSTSLFDLIIRAQNTRRHNRDNNPSGALYYVIAIVLIYGLSIILMIASQIKKNKNDKGVAKSDSSINTYIIIILLH